LLSFPEVENLGQNVTDDSQMALAIFAIVEIHSLKAASIYKLVWLWLQSFSDSIN